MSEEDIKLLKFLKALDNPIRIKIVEFILNHKEGDDIIFVPSKVSQVTEVVTSDTQNIGDFRPEPNIASDDRKSKFDLINEEDDLYGNPTEGTPLPCTPTPTEEEA